MNRFIYKCWLAASAAGICSVICWQAQLFAVAPPVTTFADISEAAIPGVVNIRTTSYRKRSNPQADIYEYFFNGKVPQMSSHSVGSGLIIDNEGHILTNNHVIDGASQIDVLFANSRQKIRARVVGRDPKTDLALLRVTPRSPLKALTFGDSDKLRVGEPVLAIGNPLGFSHTVTSGIISAKGRVIGAGPYDNFLQTDATIHPGNSGGPLLDMKGDVIGINTAISSEGAGIGFAIPANMARQVIRDLQKYGKVKRAFLGVVGKNLLSDEDLDDMRQREPRDDGVYGFLITNLVVDGPAAKSGLRLGDLVVGCDSEKVTDLNHMQRLLSGKSPSERLRLKVYRRGKGFLHLTVNLRETPSADRLPAERDLF
jgi:serine protease Do